MQLTEEERAALERYRELTAKVRGGGPSGIFDRCSHGELNQQGSIGVTLANMVIDRLFPVRTYGDLVIRWNDEITPERLVACGGRGYPSKDYLVFRGDEIEMAFWCKTGQWDIEDLRSGSGLGHRNSCWRVFRPRNMGEFWQLMERCGIEGPITT